MRRAAQFFARLAGRVSKMSGRGGGTTLPGVVLLRLRPRAAAELAETLSSGSVAISATNGKTTTARLVVAVMASAGHSITANTAGSNLLRGVTTALLTSDGDGNDLGIFEVDEAALPAVVDQVEPKVLVLMNLFRDQLDRYGEIETLIDTWRSMIDGLDPATHLVLNADDPAIASLVTGRPNVTWFGIADPSIGRSSLTHAADSTRCRGCEEELHYDLVTIGHMGQWVCPTGDTARPEPDVAAISVALDGIAGQRVVVTHGGDTIEIESQLPGLHNAYNLTAAAAVAVALGVPADQIGGPIGSTEAAFGRGERVNVDGRDVVLLLAKNPAGVNENIRTVQLEDRDTHVFALLNDRTADGQDVSWIWDVDYETLLPSLANLTLSGERSGDLALRFRYAGLASEDMVVEPDVSRALDAAIAATPEGGRLFILPTYTAMLDLRAELTRRGVTAAFWEDA